MEFERVYSVLFWLFYVPCRVFMTMVDAVFGLVYRQQGKSVSQVTEPFLLQSATALANGIRTRQYRAEDVMCAFIGRAKEVNPMVNAIVGEQYDQALRTAQDLDTMLDSLTSEQIDQDYGPDKKPFLGVPLSVKEAFAWRGMANTSGVVSRQSMISKETAPVLANMIEAGAIPFVQTNTSEMCMWIESYNPLHGRTDNAYNTTRTPGGSSGGEGSIISSGASVIGIGSDIAGSIRLPSFFNGIFGHKCSAGVVDLAGHWPGGLDDLKDMLSYGPMGRYADDLLPALKVMAGPERCAKLKLDQKVNIKDLRVISVPDDGGSFLTSAVDVELKSIQMKVAQYLQRHGAAVSEKSFLDFRFGANMWLARFNLGGATTKFTQLMTGNEEGRVNCAKQLLLYLLGMSDHSLPVIKSGLIFDVLPQWTKNLDKKSTEALEKLRQEIVQELGDDGILLYPSYPYIAPYRYHPQFTLFNLMYTGLFNALSLPVTQCPLGLSKHGLPLGVQVVAGPYNDHLCLQVASELEKGFGGWLSPGSKRA